MRSDLEGKREGRKNKLIVKAKEKMFFNYYFLKYFFQSTPFFNEVSSDFQDKFSY